MYIATELGAYLLVLTVAFMCCAIVAVSGFGAWCGAKRSLKWIRHVSSDAIAVRREINSRTADPRL
jgi:hypothetical protein